MHYPRLVTWKQKVDVRVCLRYKIYMHVQATQRSRRASGESFVRGIIDGSCTREQGSLSTSAGTGTFEEAGKQRHAMSYYWRQAKPSRRLAFVCTLPEGCSASPTSVVRLFAARVQPQAFSLYTVPGIQ